MSVTIICPYCKTPTREKNNKVYCPTCNKTRKIVDSLPTWSLK